MRTRASFSCNPHLRVSRPVSACSRCRVAKVKCDGKLPACTACEKAGRENECSAASDQQFARGKERSWVAALEARLEKLDRRLNHARSRKASVALHEPDDNTISVQDNERRDSLTDITAAIHRKAARTRERADFNTLVSDFGLLTVNATTPGFDTRETENPMSFARLVLAAAQHDALPEPDTDELPERAVVEDMFKFYKGHILSLYPLFFTGDLDVLIDKMYDTEQGFLGRIVRSSEYWLFWMVLAIASAAQSKTMHDQKYHDALHYVARALPYADRAFVPGYTSQIQSLVLLTQYSMLDPAHFDSWHLIGFACRASIDLGFHKDHTFTQQSGKDTIDARRRTFYCVYALDRAISMVHARPFSFKDDDISVQLPSRSAGNSSDQPSGQLDVSLPLFELRRLQSDWYQTLVQTDPCNPLRDPIQYVWQKYHETQKWSKELPVDLPATIRTMFDLEMDYSCVYLIVPSPRGPKLTDYERLLIFEHTIRYLHRMFEVANNPVNLEFYTYHDALKVFFMGSQLVTVLRDPGDTDLWKSLGTIQEPPRQPPLPETLDKSSGGCNIARSLLCLQKVNETLKWYGQRWEQVKTLAVHFDRTTADLKLYLETRKETVKAVLQQKAEQNTRRPLPASRPLSNPSTLAYQPPPMVQHSPQRANQGVGWGNSMGFQGHHNGQF